MEKESVTLLIQGPLNINIVRQIVLNSTFFESIVVSTWEANTEEELNVLAEINKLQENFHNVRLTIGKLPVREHENIPRSLYFQIASIANGLEITTTDQIVKTRSDEVYHLRNFMEFIRGSNSKFHFGNFIVRDWRYHSFHISDHLFGSPRINLVYAICWLNSVEKETLMRLLGKDWNVPESLLGFSLFISVRGEPRQRLRPWPTFLRFTNYFKLFDIENLDNFEVRARSAGTGYLSNVAEISLEKADLLNWNYFTKTWQMRPSYFSSFYRRKIQPMIRQSVLRAEHVKRTNPRKEL